MISHHRLPPPRPLVPPFSILDFTAPCLPGVHRFCYHTPAVIPPCLVLLHLHYSSATYTTCRSATTSPRPAHSSDSRSAARFSPPVLPISTHRFTFHTLRISRTLRSAFVRSSPWLPPAYTARSLGSSPVSLRCSLPFYVSHHCTGSTLTTHVLHYTLLHLPLRSVPPLVLDPPLRFFFFCALGCLPLFTFLPFLSLHCSATLVPTPRSPRFHVGRSAHYRYVRYVYHTTRFLRSGLLPFTPVSTISSACWLHHRSPCLTLPFTTTLTVPATCVPTFVVRSP